MQVDGQGEQSRVWGKLVRVVALVAALLGLTLLPACGPLPYRTQVPLVTHRIGYLSLVSAQAEAGHIENLKQGLRELGWIEGQNLLIEWRFAEGNSDKLPELAADLVRRKVEIIFATSSAPALVAKGTTSEVPIVFGPTVDPVGTGLVASLARPGGNATGLTANMPELGGKQLEYLKETVPGLSRVAVLWNPASQGHSTLMREVEMAAQALGVGLVPLEVRAPDQLEPAFELAMARQADGLLVFGGPSVADQERRIATLALEHRLPSMYPQRRYVEVGGLMAYGMSVPAAFRHAATLVDKILRGRNPAELPVERPMRFELVVNVKTAQVLGINIPSFVQGDVTDTIQ